MSGNVPALILTDDTPAGQAFASAAQGILKFTGVPSVTASCFPATPGAVFISRARTFLNCAKAGGNGAETLAGRPGFIFAGGDQAAYQKVLEMAGARVQTFEKGDFVRVEIAEDERQLCGPYAGLAFGNVAAPGFVWINGSLGIRSLVRAPQDAVGFAQAGRWFFCGAAGPVNLEERQTFKRFDIKRCFFELVPLLFFVRHLYGEFPRRSPEPLACLTVDDPLLRETYGRFRIRDVLPVLQDEGLALSLGFIPWNFRRSSPEIANLVREQPRLSLTVHGCDHTKHEFKARDFEKVNWLAKMALERMQAHQADAGTGFDPVMVFPEGAFSPEAIAALRGNNYLATLNTHGCADGDVAGPTIQQRIEPANLNYNSFPILTRRYLEHGLENFAFDMLVGRPCIIATHHHDYHDGMSSLIGEIEAVRKLGPLAWKPMGSLVRSLYKMESGNQMEVFSNEIIYRHSSERSDDLQIKKLEQNPASIRVLINGKEVIHEYENGFCVVRHKVAPGETIHIRYKYAGLSATKSDSGWLYGQKVRWRRYFSEVRDRVLLRPPTIVPVD